MMPRRGSTTGSRGTFTVSPRGKSRAKAAAPARTKASASPKTKAKGPVVVARKAGVDRARVGGAARAKAKATSTPVASSTLGKLPARSASPRGSTGSASPTSEVLRHGQGWSRTLLRGQVLRITDTTGTGCVSALFYNARSPVERYNVADTLKAQYTAFLTSGRVLYSDMGRILASIVGDSCGWHDTIGGCGSAPSQLAQFGAGDYQTLGNEYHRNARDNFIIELSKVGLGKRDIVANVNFFARLVVDELGALSWVEGNSRPGAYVDLRADMDTLVVLSNTPHPLAPTSTYPSAEVTVAVSIRAATGRERGGPRDPCLLSRPENARGFALTAAYVAESAGLGAIAATWALT
jgi:urea carboxylase-associated protein 2